MAKYKEMIIMVICMIICICMGIHSYQEGYMANVIKWVVILVMTVVLYTKWTKKKRGQ